MSAESATLAVGTPTHVHGDGPVAGHGAGHGHGDPNVAHQFDDAAQQHEAAMLGMWSFLATEVLFFGGLFTAYVIYRSTAQLPFELASGHLNVILGAVNTGVLLVSSLLVALAVREAQLGNAKKVNLLIIGTIILGATFILVKAFEWTTDYHEGLIPFASNFQVPEENLKQWDEAKANYPGINFEGRFKLFWVLYFFMTGLHGIHVIVGLAVFAVVVALVRKRSQTGQDYENLVEVTGLYWHFVDIVWVFLYPLMYLIHPVMESGGHH
jgi:cytochrome c oxidase subunit 3